MKPTSAATKQRLWMLSGIALTLLSVSGCATTRGTTGIEAPATPTQPARLSLCEVLSREELQPSRQDTEVTRDNLGGALVKYDQFCGVATE